MVQVSCTITGFVTLVLGLYTLDIHGTTITCASVLFKKVFNQHDDIL